MAYSKLAFAPGVYKDDSPLDAKGWFTDANKMRPVRGKYQTIGGWEGFTTNTFVGISRGLFAWADRGRNPFLANGTHLRLYASDVDGNQYDITPVVSRGELTNPFTTSVGLTTVTVSHTSHGLVENQKVSFANATAVGGITINGDYTVGASPATNSYTITHSAAATASAGPGGGTVDYEYFLAPGQQDGLGGLGFGTGGFGTGTYGSSASGYTLFPRTWSFDNWGQNLIANPRSGAIFEWAPYVTPTETVTNGNFSASAGWIVSGAGLTITPTVANFSVSNGTVQQNITLNAGAWHLLDFDLTISAGTITAYYGNTTIVSGGTTATYKTNFFSGSGGSQALKFTGIAATANLDNASVKVLATAAQLPNAPSTVGSVFVTAERRLVACGRTDSNGNFDPLEVGWSGLVSGTTTPDNNVWTTGPTTTAGRYKLSQGTRIVRGMAGNGVNLIWTDNALYAMRYVPDVNVIYRFDLIATGCGLIGPNAVCQVRGVFFWLTPSGEFFTYSGGAPEPMQSTIRRDLFDNLSWVQQDKVYAFNNSAYDEAWFLYPDIRDGNEASRYVMFSLGTKTWTNGTFDRTAWVDSGIFQYPIAASSLGKLWYHEKGFTEDGGARSWSLTSSYFDIADGDRHMTIMGAYPDVEDLQGGYSLTVNIQNNDARGISTRTLGPYSINSATGKVSIRAKGRRMQLVFSGNDAPTFFRMGAFAIDAKPSGDKR